MALRPHTTAPRPRRHPDPSTAALRAPGRSTGYRPTYPWLDNALLDRRGQIIHEGGVMAAARLYVVDLPLLRRRKSSFLDGIGADTVDPTVHVRAHLDRNMAAA